jgi:regulatory protein
LKRSVLNPGRLWQKNGALSQSRSSRPVRPLDLSSLESLALHYVGRFATTEARLGNYLDRKIKMRGWTGDEPPPITAIVARFAAAGYVNDVEFAQARARSLTNRGYGHRRLVQALRAAGVSPTISETLVPDGEAARQAAEAFARRRRLGPFSGRELSHVESRRHFAAMVRAGHDFELAKFYSSSGSGDANAEQQMDYDH